MKQFFERVIKNIMFKESILSWIHLYNKISQFKENYFSAQIETISGKFSSLLYSRKSMFQRWTTFKYSTCTSASFALGARPIFKHEIKNTWLTMLGRTDVKPFNSQKTEHFYSNKGRPSRLLTDFHDDLLRVSGSGCCLVYPWWWKWIVPCSHHT